MKLIDRDLFLKAVKTTPQFESVSELLERYIQYFPVSFDTEKVIEQFKNNADFKTGEDGTVISEYLRLSKAIEILKSGGVED